MAEIIIGKDKEYKYIKRIWLDIDDTIYDSSPLIQKYVDIFFPLYCHQNLEAKQRTVALWKSYYQYQKNLLAEAKRLGITPDMTMFNRVMYPKGQDDVIRTKVRQKYEAIIDDRDYKLYEEPLLIIGESINDAQKDLDWFYELRTSQLETDGKKPNGDIPYELIYRRENLLPYAEENLLALYKRFGSLIAALSAHNGIDDMHGREFEAKVEGLKSIIKELDVYGIRFKPKDYDPHNDQIRDRSLKSTAIRKASGLMPDEPITGHILCDDSLFNDDDTYNEGGVPIYIVPKNIDKLTASELNVNNYGMARSIQLASLEREFRALHLDSEDEGQVLRKKLVA